MRILTIAMLLLGTPLAHAVVAHPFLEVKDLSGSGFVVQDVFVATDGSVTKAGPNGPVVVKQLAAPDLDAAVEAVAALQEGELQRLNPNQPPNPGGFVRKYILWKEGEADPFVFAFNQAGMGYGLIGSGEGRRLVSLLDELDQEARK